MSEGDFVARKYYVSGQSLRIGSLLTVPARHLELEQPVTLTYLTPEACEDPSRVDHFFRRAKLVARIPSAHAAKVLDVGRLDFGSPYAAVERPAGWSFAEVLRVRGALPIGESCDYVVQACRAVADAHAAGLRRANPNVENLLLTRASNGSAIVKAVLFGAASADAEEILTADFFHGGDASNYLSLLAYVAPESIRHARIGNEERADVWALGVVLYELVTATPAFSAPTATAMLAAIAADAAPKLSSVRHDAPGALQAIVDRCIAKDPAERYASVQELGLALSSLSPEAESVASWRPSRPASRLPPPPLPSFPPTARTVTATTPSTAPPKITPRTIDRGLALAVGAVLGVLTVSAWRVLGTRESGNAPAQVAAQPESAPAPPAPSVAVQPPPVASQASDTHVPPSIAPATPPRAARPAHTDAFSKATVALNEAAAQPLSTRAAASSSARTSDAPPRATNRESAPEANPAETTGESGARHDSAPATKGGDRRAAAKSRDTDLFDDLP
ncbi:MAG TPA: serine/threonine-protein kinase [Polyangiaceae bacterium]|nr:serine/threonine-protein kinase [Polyangiaceae bacterium]